MVTIHEAPRIVVFTNEDLSQPRTDLNVDVEVTDTSDKRWSATFFPLENVHAIFSQNALTGECGGGLYLWSSDMVLVRSVSFDLIRTTVLQLMAAGEFESAFGLV